MRFLTLTGPPNRPLHSLFKLSAPALKIRTLIKTHDNIGAKFILSLGYRFRIEIYLRSVNMTAKFNTSIADSIKTAQRKNLVSAAVGKYRPTPAHQLM